MTFSGKVAVITGASRGIGFAIADRLAAQGARVAIGARGTRVLEEAALALRRHGCDVLARPLDVAVDASVEAFAQAVVEQFGRVDVLVNNAGAVERGPTETLSEKQWDHVLDVNLKGTFLTTRAFLPLLRAQGQGRIINLSSIAGRRGTALSAAYCAAKHGVLGFSRALAEEVRELGILVYAICPGSVATAMLPAEFAPGMPADRIAEVALFLASSAPREMTGAAVDVFG